MKIIVFSLLLLPLHLLSQTIDTPMNSISLLGEARIGSPGNNNASMSTLGVQYRKKGKKYLSHTFTAGYGSYSYSRYDNLIKISGDTAKTRRFVDNINLGILGSGIEAERQFYKKLYFFAGLELHAGYGTGTADTTITKQYNVLLYNPHTGTLYETMVYGPGSTTSGPESMFYIGLTPYFGLKLEFKRVSIGTAFMNYVTFSDIMQKAGNTYGSIDFDMGNITQRIFVSYKF